MVDIYQCGLLISFGYALRIMIFLALGWCGAQEGGDIKSFNVLNAHLEDIFGGELSWPMNFMDKIVPRGFGLGGSLFCGFEDFTANLQRFSWGR